MSRTNTYKIQIIHGETAISYVGYALQVNRDTHVIMSCTISDLYVGTRDIIY